MCSSESEKSATMKSVRSHIGNKAQYCAVYAVVGVLVLVIFGQLWVFESTSGLGFSFLKAKVRINESYAVKCLRNVLIHDYGNSSEDEPHLIVRNSSENEAHSIVRNVDKEKNSPIVDLEDKFQNFDKKNLYVIDPEDKFQSNESTGVTIESLKHETETLKLELENLGNHLRESVMFLPLKDTSVAPTTEPDRTWFMSTIYGKSENGNPEYHYFPSEKSQGKILCVKGRDRSNGTLNSYGFAWPKYLPPNSTLLPGISFVSDNFYDYANPWHSMSALVVSAAWRMGNDRCVAPDRFVLYHNGELVETMGSWILNVLRAALDRAIVIEKLDYGDQQRPVCFEKAVVYRRGLGHMSLDKRIALFDMIRCKARKLCNVAQPQRSVAGKTMINVTLVARTGERSFKNESIVASTIEKECRRVVGCNFRLLHIANKSFCEQVSAMSTTDILATAHGAQLTNMMFLSKGSSVMEMFPKGWLEGAGVGQYIYHWLASWSGMNHEGTYRDTEGPDCPYPERGRIPCFLFHKDMQVGHNTTYLAHWTADVLARFVNRTTSTTLQGANRTSYPTSCPCD